MTDTKTGRGKELIRQVNYLATDRFIRWFQEERERRFLTNAGLLQELALNYIIQTKDAARWPEGDES